MFLFIREIQIITMLKNYFAHIRLEKLKIFEHILCYRGCRKVSPPFIAEGKVNVSSPPKRPTDLIQSQSQLRSSVRMKRQTMDHLEILHLA